ncbi:hypothetical protein BDR22DRAFT_977441 [Usnea florida]
MSAPATPQSQPPQATVSTPSPGNWRHPRADEIARRQKANTFDSNNIRKIAYNGGALLILFLAWSNSWPPLIPQPLTLLLSLLTLYNITTALLPLKSTDTLSDIPLTPTQRALLGLNPTPTPTTTSLTPASQYITPPRYPRSPTPRNISPATRNASVYSTPITSSPSFGRGDGDAGVAASPAWQRSLGEGGGRRSSYGSPSPLGPAYGGGGVGTPSPGAGRGVGVGLNNKWLYQRGRSASGSRYPKMYTGGTLVDY